MPPCGGFSTVVPTADNAASRREVAIIEVEQVVVRDVLARRPAGAGVPRGLEQAAGDQPAVGQREGVPVIEDRAIDAVGGDVAQEARRRDRIGPRRRPLQAAHSTVTLLARLRGLSTSVPRAQAV